MPTLMGLAQAARELGDVTAGTLKVQAQRGRLRAERVGRDWLVSPAEVERYRREVMGRRGRLVTGEVRAVRAGERGGRRPAADMRTAAGGQPAGSDLSDSVSAHGSDLRDSVSRQMSDQSDSVSSFGHSRPAPKPGKKR